MTDFGSRVGTGDMLKSSYDTDQNGVVDLVIAHKTSHQDTGTDEINVAGLNGELADDQPLKAHDLGGAKHNTATLAELNAKVSDATLDDSASTRTPTAHKTSHQDGGADQINLTGLVGSTPTALLADATPGRVFRALYIQIIDGTDNNTLKCTVGSRFNGDVIATQDNIALNATTGHFTLDSEGYLLTIEAAGLSGNVLHAMAQVTVNGTGTDILCSAQAFNNDIRIKVLNRVASGHLDLTTLVDAGDLNIDLQYLADA